MTLQDYQDKPLTTAADLALLCAAKPDGDVGTAAINFCHGFARGAVAAHLQREAASRRPLKLFCFPTPSPASGPTLDAFAAWVKDNPAQGNQKPVDGLFRFLGKPRRIIVVTAPGRAASPCVRHNRPPYPETAISDEKPIIR